MSTLEQMRSGLERVWGHLSEGWHHLRDMAGNAITRFSPAKGGTAEGREVEVMHRSPRWGLLVAEVEERDKDFVVRLEVPGMEKEDFEITVVNDSLVIRGEKRVEREETQGYYHITECAYGRFERVIPLPSPVNESKAKASYKKGVLKIVLPKSGEGRTRRIKIESA